MKKTALFLLLLLALTAFASVARADWYGDRLKPGPIRIGDGDLMTVVERHTKTYNDAYTTSYTLAVTGAKAGDVFLAQPVNYRGTAALVATSCSTNRVYVKWSADPGTTVTVELIQFRVD